MARRTPVFDAPDLLGVRHLASRRRIAHVASNSYGQGAYDADDVYARSSTSGTGSSSAISTAATRPTSCCAG